MFIKFYSKCKRCETEEEFSYIGAEDSKFDCLRCGEKLSNEIIEDTIIAII
jgi:hypothetical protein